MRPKNQCLSAAALALAVSSVQANQVGSIDAFYVVDAEIEANAAQQDGDGAGVRAWGQFSEYLFGKFEFQSTETDATPSLEVEQLRLGMGVLFPLGPSLNAWASGELERFDFSSGGASDEEEGFGVHGGLHMTANQQLSFGISLGYLSLDDLDGTELEFNARFLLTPQFSLLGSYRMSSLEDDNGNELDLNDLRVGVGLHF